MEQCRRKVPGVKSSQGHKISGNYCKSSDKILKAHAHALLRRIKSQVIFKMIVKVIKDELKRS